MYIVCMLYYMLYYMLLYYMYIVCMYVCNMYVYQNATCAKDLYGKTIFNFCCISLALGLTLSETDKQKVLNYVSQLPTTLTTENIGSWF